MSATTAARTETGAGAGGGTAGGTGARGPLCRVRTVLRDPATGGRYVDEHIRARLTADRSDQADRALLGDVLVAYGTGRAAAAGLARAHPGALVVAVHWGARCWIRLGPDGTVLRLEARQARQGPWWDELWEGMASLAHSWLAAGQSGAALGSVREFEVQVADASPSSRVSRCRVVSASSVSALPTEV